MALVHKPWRKKPLPAPDSHPHRRTNKHSLTHSCMQPHRQCRPTQLLRLPIPQLPRHALRQSGHAVLLQLLRRGRRRLHLRRGQRLVRRVHPRVVGRRGHHRVFARGRRRHQLVRLRPRQRRRGGRRRWAGREGVPGPTMARAGARGVPKFGAVRRGERGGVDDHGRGGDAGVLRVEQFGGRGGYVGEIV